MKNSDKIVEGEKTPDNKNDAKKESIKPIVIKQNENKAEFKETTVISDLPKNVIEESGAPIAPLEVKTGKEKKNDGKKGAKAELKITDLELSKKQEKAEGEIVVQSEVEAGTKKEQEKPDTDKKIKVIKKNAKKAEEKVGKLKKKVKKAKKKEVKPSKIKALKEKLGKALDKLKSRLKKLKKAKK